MASESDGSPGNRPGARPEITKLPRHACERCGMCQARPIVDGDEAHGYYCTNLTACRKRARQQGLPWGVDIEDV